MLRLFKWIASLFTHRTPEPTITGAGAGELHPLVREGLERERQQQIVNRLRAFYARRPRPWRAGCQR